MKWESYRNDFRAFCRLAYASVDPGEDTRLIREIERGEKTICTKGVKKETFALLACWRLACWPRSTTLVVSSTPKEMEILLDASNQLLVESEDVLRERILFFPRKQGMTCAVASKIGFTFCSSGTLGLDLPQAVLGEAPLLFLIPDLDKVPGPHLKYIPRLRERIATTVVANVHA